MGLMRCLMLAASQNRWLRDHATQYSFVRGTVSRFMPGETLDDALGAAETLRSKRIGTIFTHLGENIKDRGEAQQVAEHYLEVLKDRKSTRLNSSHLVISYAVFCLKKKKNNQSGTLMQVLWYLSDQCLPFQQECQKSL